MMVTQHLAGETVVGEGPRWDPQRRRLIWVDIEQRQVNVRANGVTRSYLTPDRVGVAMPTASDRLLIAYGTQVGLLSPEDGSIEPIGGRAGDPGRMRFNDGATDRHGALWLSTAPIDELNHGMAGVYRLEGDGTFTCVLGDIGLANGPAFSPAGDAMYVSDTLTHRILRLSLDSTGAVVGGAEVLIDTSSIDGSPDGIAIDVDGRLWVAFWDGGAVHCFEPDGQLATSVELPVSRATSCAFIGADLDRLAITTARWGLTRSDLEHQPLAGSILELDPGVRGYPTMPVAGYR